MKAENDIFRRIHRRLVHLHPALKRIAAYVLENPDKVKLEKIQELAAQCRVSVATVSRFVKQIDLRSFQELKIAIAESISNAANSDRGEERFVYDDVKEHDCVKNIVEKVTHKNIDTLNTTKELLSHADIEKAVEAIEMAELIVIYCSGSSVVAGYNAKSRFYRVGKQCILYSDATEQNISAPLLDKRCVVIGITSSGRTKAVVNAVRMAHEAGARTICITDSTTSPILAHADICFITSSIYSSFMQDTMTSRMPHILIIDILYACFAVKHYQKSLESIEKSMAAADAIFYPNGRKSFSRINPDENKP